MKITNENIHIRPDAREFLIEAVNEYLIKWNYFDEDYNGEGEIGDYLKIKDIDVGNLISIMSELKLNYRKIITNYSVVMKVHNYPVSGFEIIGDLRKEVAKLHISNSYLQDELVKMTSLYE